jgi:hypothetical protein
MSTVYYTVTTDDDGVLTTYQTTQLPNLASILDQVTDETHDLVDITIGDGETTVTI